MNGNTSSNISKEKLENAYRLFEDPNRKTRMGAILYWVFCKDKLFEIGIKDLTIVELHRLTRISRNTIPKLLDPIFFKKIQIREKLFDIGLNKEGFLEFIFYWFEKKSNLSMTPKEKEFLEKIIFSKAFLGIMWSFNDKIEKWGKSVDFMNYFIASLNTLLNILSGFVKASKTIETEKNNKIKIWRKLTTFWKILAIYIQKAIDDTSHELRDHLLEYFPPEKADETIELMRKIFPNINDLKDDYSFFEAFDMIVFHPKGNEILTRLKKIIRYIRKDIALMEFTMAMIYIIPQLYSKAIKEALEDFTEIFEEYMESAKTEQQMFLEITDQQLWKLALKNKKIKELLKEQY